MEYYRLNELPETYKRYKTFTDGFEKWMIKVGKQRGLEIAEQAEAAALAAAAKEKKKNGRPKSYNILKKDMLPMAEAIAESGIPDEDVSGLADLKDAIRLRKEVNEWYRHMKLSDEQHPLFISLLDHVLKILDPRKKLGGKKPSRKTGITILFNLSNNLRHPDNVKGDDDIHEDDDESTPIPTEEPSDTFPASSSAMRARPQTTEAERELEQDFEVLCFLYDLYSLRCRVKDIWNDWMQQKIGTMTAALASDIAMSRVYQRATVLNENLKEESKKRTILQIIEKLRNLGTGGSTFPSGKDELAAYPKDLLCNDAIRLMNKFWSMRPDEIKKGENMSPRDSFCLRFLAHFKLIRANELRVAAGLPLDKFTESLTSPEVQSEAWLPFGFQILLDIQETLTIQMKNVQWDIIDHATHVGKSLQEHFTYEDEVWDTEDRPDYMAIGGMKWASSYLHFLSRLIDWAQQLLNDTPEAVSGMTNAYFLAVHPVLSGRTMWDYHRTFHTAAIGKIQWFAVGLAHLYNACRQVGGLDIPWPDLEFIIHCQGPARVYIGGAPTDPNVFSKRLALALCGSSTEFAPDHRGNHHISSEIKAKRGFADYFPLEERLAKYFQSSSRSDRSSRLHNLFASLHNARKKSAEAAPGTGASTSSKVPDKARSIFEMIAAKRARNTKNKKNRKKNKSRVPDFSKVDCVHAELLSDIVSQLTEHEVYANFDHLHFFRLAITVINFVRREILWDDSKALSTLDSEQEPPNDFHLVYNLLHSLKPPRDKTQKKQAKNFQDGMEKIRKISDVMRAFIEAQGDVEKKNAEEQTRRRRQHDTLLSAVYSAHAKSAPVSFKDLLSVQPKFSAQPSYDFGQTSTSFSSVTDTMSSSLRQATLDRATELRAGNPQDGSDKLPIEIRQAILDRADEILASDLQDSEISPTRSIATQTEDEREVSSRRVFVGQTDGRTILVPRGKLGARGYQIPGENGTQQPPAYPEPKGLHAPLVGKNKIMESYRFIPLPRLPSPDSHGNGTSSVHGDRKSVVELSDLIRRHVDTLAQSEDAKCRTDPARESEHTASEPAEIKSNDTVQNEICGSNRTEVFSADQEKATDVIPEEIGVLNPEEATPSPSFPLEEAPPVEVPYVEGHGFVIRELEDLVCELETEPAVQTVPELHVRNDRNERVQVESPVENESIAHALPEVQDDQGDRKEETQVKTTVESEPMVHDPPAVREGQEHRKEAAQQVKQQVARECSWRFVKYILSALSSLERVITGRIPSVPEQDTDDLVSAPGSSASDSAGYKHTVAHFVGSNEVNLPSPPTEQFHDSVSTTKESTDGCTGNTLPESHTSSETVPKTRESTKHCPEVVSFGVYHRMTYPSKRPSRSTRRRYLAKREHLDEISSRALDRLHPRQHSVGLNKRTICHVCHGRCWIGKELLEEGYSAYWDRQTGQKEEGKDDWETEDEEDELAL